MFEFLEDLARSRGMPADYKIYAVEVLGDPPNFSKLMKVTGDKPIGLREDGRPKWARTKKQGASPLSVTITDDEYRAALNASKATPEGKQICEETDDGTEK